MFPAPCAKSERRGCVESSRPTFFQSELNYMIGLRNNLHQSRELSAVLPAAMRYGRALN